MADLNSPSFKLPVLGSAPAEAVRPVGGYSRRSFLQMAGGAGAAATLAACHPAPDVVAPYVTKPEDVTPGVPLHYASALPAHTGVGAGVMVTAWEGRPTKIEGNPKHPVSKGATGVFEQAATLSLYDPSRARAIKHQGHDVARETFTNAWHKKGIELAARNGEGLFLFLEPTSSRLVGEQLNQLKQKFPAAVVRFHAPAGSDAEVAGATLSFGKALIARPDLRNAKVIVSLDSDFLIADPENIAAAREWAEGREFDGAMSRLYVAECRMSVTGSNADHRFPMQSTEVGAFARELAGRVAQRANNAGLASLARGYKPASVSDKAFTALVEDLFRNPGASVVLVGERQPAAVHALGHALNAMLGAVEKTVEYAASPLVDPFIGAASLKAMVDDLQAGKVDTLLLSSWEPTYARAADLDIEGALHKAKSLIYTGSHDDGTARLAEWFVPASHPLESWGDVRAIDGTASLVQPLIEPLGESFTLSEILSALLDPAPRKAHQLLKNLLGTQAATPAGQPTAVAPDLDTFWASSLQLGYVDDTQIKAEHAEVNFPAVLQAATALAQPSTGVELNFVTDYRVLDGRFAHVPLMQELPDPITKLTWDNAVLLSQRTATDLHLELEQVVEIKVGGKTIRGPILVSPGHADGAITVSLGYGQKLSDDDAPRVGFDAYSIRTSTAPWFEAGAEVRGIDERYPLAITQGWFKQEGRNLANVFDIADKKKIDAELKSVRGALPNINDAVAYDGYKWGMGVDLSRCTGCNACVIACVVENNVPIVGKTNVRKGREMHWLRLDRYYVEGTPDGNPTVVTQPTMCQHCENAPCEYVCPVNATMHSDEGLNEMIYNRCVGTRYCSNNCPYKVRRFNFFNYTGDRTPTEMMEMNPDVTVRSRGVMEKCTFCVQRIERTRVSAEIANRPIGPEEIKTACSEACPTKAITFGNLNYQDSEVAKAFRDERHYYLLHSLGTRPRVAYLSRITNKNPEVG